MFRLASLAAISSLLLAAAASAQAPTSRIDSIFSFATAETPGCAVGVSQRGTVVVNRAYGLADVERRVPLSPSSRFDIGSTQKQFVAAAVLLLVEEGRLSLTDDIRRYIPELPEYGHRLTLDHLLTHTSGLRDWTGILPMAEEGTDVLELILRQRGLNFAPGEAWSYSNSGYVLLKEIVARASGMSFAEFARRRLFEPLGMQSSAYVTDILQGGGHAALGYQKEGSGWRQYMRVGNERGGGTIAATVGDLLMWNDALTSGALGGFVTGKLQEPARLANGRALRYARGLMVDSTPGGVVVQHSGGAAGFSTWLGRVPEHDLSVAVACNFDPVSATALAGRVSDLFLPPVDSQARPAGPVAAAGVDVSGRAGLFFSELTGEPLRLVVNGGRLTIANGPPLVPVSTDGFRPPRPYLLFRSQDNFELRFVSPDRFELRSMEGGVERYRRAIPHAHTAAEVQGYDGRYRSEELGSTLEILAGANGLVMRLESEPEKSQELAPVERDVWMRSMMIVRFRRDASGRVVGFDYGNPLARGVGFRRVGDRVVSATTPVPPDAAGAARAPQAGTPAAAGAAASPADPGTSTTAAPRLEALAGEYELAPGRTLAITLEDGRLHGQPPGSEKRALSHVSGTTFSVAGSPLTLTFTVGADGRATGVVMRQEGRERSLTRIR